MVAKENPDVEFVVRRLKQGKAAILRGHYGELTSTIVCNDFADLNLMARGIVNGRDKVVCVNSLDRQQVANKVSSSSNHVVLHDHCAALDFTSEVGSSADFLRVLSSIRNSWISFSLLEVERLSI